MRPLLIATTLLTSLIATTAHAGQDLTFSSFAADHDSVAGTVDITLTVTNMGDTWVTSNFFIDLFAVEDGDWGACGVVDWEFTAHSSGIAPGATEDFVFTLHADDVEGGSLYAYVDLDDIVSGEDDEDNNAAVLMVVHEDLPAAVIDGVPKNNPACLQAQSGMIPAADDAIVAIIPELP